YAAPRPLNSASFDAPPYDQNTLPLIVPGPHVVQTNVPGTSNSLMLNNTVNAVDVVFDRDMDPTSFEADGRDVLRIIGPTGKINGPFTVTANPNNSDPDPLHPRTFRIGFPTQD